LRHRSEAFPSQHYHLFQLNRVDILIKGHASRVAHYFLSRYAEEFGSLPDKFTVQATLAAFDLEIAASPLSVAPPRSTRFGSPLVLSRVHWVEPKLVVEITYLTWTADNLLRHTVYVGLREDKPAREVRQESARLP
jgi:ATP-dependent DNA ligase